MTPLDAAHAAMEASPEEAGPRLAFYARLAEAELSVLLDGEPVGDRARPLILETGEGRFAFAFDLAERLASFAEGPAPFLALSGRRLAGLLAGEGVGLALNAGVAPSSFFLDAAGVDWLAATLADPAERRAVLPGAVHPPGALPPQLLTALDARLRALALRPAAAHLVEAEGAEGRRLTLALTGLPEEAEAATAAAIGEAVRLSGLEAGTLDIAFLPKGSEAARRIASLGIAIELPEPEAPGQVAPDAPPRLR
ncbi:MAG: SseB family protein [Pseudomonadota bacterium]